MDDKIIFAAVFHANFLLRIDAQAFQDSLETGVTRVWAILIDGVLWLVAAGPEQKDFSPEEHGEVLDGSVLPI